MPGSRTDVMVTYEQLFDILRREKSRDELQVLDKNFYTDVKRFLTEKQHAADQSMAGQKSHIEFQNTQRILRELYDRRERKILTLAMHKTRTDAVVVDSEALLSEERALFDSIVQTLTATRKDILISVPLAPEPIPEPSPEVEEPIEVPTTEAPQIHQETALTVTFASTVPKFVGKDLTVYGPFTEGEQATLPESVAKILIQKGRASTS